MATIYRETEVIEQPVLDTSSLVLPTSRGQRLTDLIGNTPLLRLRSLEPHAGIEIYGKAEWFNPGGSVKDRAALAMIEAGERTGALTKETIILDATSGNTGIAYAMVRRMAREEGILIGISGGAALAVAERVANEFPVTETAVIVTILPDSGNRYLSDRFWNEG